MNANEQLIRHFYTCFQKKDYAGMQQCYAHNATFNDTVFKNLDALHVKAMWEMLLRNGKDLSLEFSDVHANETAGSANWVATYTFSKTGNKVINRIHAEFRFENGKIVQHTDRFNFYTWARQALGLTGLVLGWTTFLKNKIQAAAMQNLEAFIKKQS